MVPGTNIPEQEIQMKKSIRRKENKIGTFLMELSFLP